MECSSCHRSPDYKRLPFLCAVDARNALYEGRMKNAQLLIQNESLQEEISGLLAEANSRDALDRDVAQREVAEARTSEILAAADKLRADIEEARAKAKKMRAEVTSRRSHLDTVSQGLEEIRSRKIQNTLDATQHAAIKWTQNGADMRATRSFLCAEAAKLYGLEPPKRGDPSRGTYQLGRIPVVNLADMNLLSAEEVSTSLAHVSHMLMLASHYLAIRLPAELTLPHRDYPRPTIFNLATSYRHGDVPFPNTPGIPNSSSETRLPNKKHASLPRPRPLFIDKSLPQLSKEDPAAYSFFLEGVTLLAYDIAWLCCSQGAFTGDKGTFDDICNMGRNLHNLLITQKPSSTHHPTPNITGNTVHADSQEDKALTVGIGSWSHGTAAYFLSGADGTEFAKSFKLPSPMKLADKLKRKLLGDAPAPDWEVLDDTAWKTEDVATPDAGTEDKGSPQPAPRGWTKVKTR